MSERPKVLFLCTGVGIFNRGIETFFREAFDGLRDSSEVEIQLAKGAGASSQGEHVLWNFPRTGRLAPMIGGWLKRNGYVVEQLSAFPAAVALIRRLRPDVIFYSDSNLGFQLHRWRSRIGVPYRLLFSNGGPCLPPFVRTDFIHQVAPFYLQQALAAGEPRERHFLVPYGVRVPPEPGVSPEKKAALRSRLNLPTDRPIILSVGWISREHKRMHYVIEELAKLPPPRPFLQLLGAMDAESREIVELGNSLLGAGNFSACSVTPEEVAGYYAAADVFVLASLAEGFGRVYLEALMHGLPVIAHRHPVMEYVLGNEGRFGDLSQPGALTNLLREALIEEPTDEVLRRRWRSVKDRFSWEALRPQYEEMFKACVRQEGSG